MTVTLPQSITLDSKKLRLRHHKNMARIIVVLLLDLPILIACSNSEKERCQAKYDQMLTDGYSTSPETHDRGMAEVMSFLNGPCAKYLQ
jgi:hypothetical protein